MDNKVNGKEKKILFYETFSKIITLYVCDVLRVICSFLFGIVIYTFLNMLFCGCKTIERQIPVEIPTILKDTVILNTSKIDTLIRKDSIYISGDTIERFHTIYKIRQRIDTLRMTTVDSIRIPVYINKTEEKKNITWWMWLISLFFMLVCLAIKIIK